ncbi:MAG: hypothetical protein HRU09_12310 [Oligoflexales bacterium]|nr:hypothetical protein [Oligoflexales bacterium]
MILGKASILLGTLVLAVALIKGYRLFALLAGVQLRFKWAPLYGLMVFFLFGYLYTFLSMVQNTPLSIQAIVGFIFFFGSIFVILSVSTVERISRHLMNSEAHLKECCDEISAKNHEAQKERLLAQKANSAKSFFIANLSHEIKTPLSAIDGFTKLVKVSLDNKDQVTVYLDAVSRNIAHLNALIEDILNLSHIESGKLVLRKKTVSLLCELNTIHATFVELAKQKGLEFKVELLNSVPKEVFTDALRLKQILLNVIGNAIKFTMHGYVQVTVSYESQENDTPPFLVFGVEDSGPGIPPQAVSRIFSPFNQVHKELNPSCNGSGLGLSIARNLAGLLGGDVLYSPNLLG